MRKESFLKFSILNICAINIGYYRPNLKIEFHFRHCFNIGGASIENLYFLKYTPMQLSKNKTNANRLTGDASTINKRLKNLFSTKILWRFRTPNSIISVHASDSVMA
jgi:hypothetical protein